MSREKPDDPYADRKALTFEQAEGIVPLPTQLLPKEVSRELSALLWAVVHASLNRTGGARHRPLISVSWRGLDANYVRLSCAT